MKDDLCQKVQELVSQELACSAHSLDHVMRVFRLCLDLAEGMPGIDLEVLKLSALLHDIARAKEDREPEGKIDHAVLGAEMAGTILRDLEYPEEKIRPVQHCIKTHRFRTGHEPQTIEAQILFDADKLDVTGAIGIARMFMFAGLHGEPLYSDVPVTAYVRDNLAMGKVNGRIKDMSKHSPNLEYETKLKHLPEKLYTPMARDIARKRLEFMELFFRTLGQELNSRSPES